MRWFSRARRPRSSEPDPDRREARRLLRPGARAAGGLPPPRSRGHGGGGQERHGQDDALQRDHGPRPRVGQRAARRRGDPGTAAPCHHQPGRGVRAAGPARVAVAHRGRAPAPRGGGALGRVDRGARVPDVPAARGTEGQRRRRALGRRAADARHRAGAALQPDPARDGRADGGAGAGHRAPGGRHAEAPGGGRGDLRAADRAEPRRGDRGRRHRGRDGERAHRALDARRRARGGPRAAAAPARREGRRGRGRR